MEVFSAVKSSNLTAKSYLSYVVIKALMICLERILTLSQTSNVSATNDYNLLSMSKQQWKTFVTDRIKHHAFEHLTGQCGTNRKTMHLKYSKLGQATYFTALKPKYARVIFKARTRMYDIKTNFTEKYEGNTFCPFCRRNAESFEHIFKCQDGLICPLNTYDITLESFVDFSDTRFLKRVSKYLIKYEKFREVVI